MSYTYIYYTTAIVVFLALPVFTVGPAYRATIGLRTFLVFYVVSVYFIGMLRTEGKDLFNYRYAYDIDPNHIPDIGYQFFSSFFQALGLPFPILMLFIAGINTYAIFRAARYFNVSTGLLLIFWFLHLAIVRDFSQLRIAFAVSVALIGVTSKSQTTRWLLYFFSASIHITSLAFFLSYEITRRVAYFRSKVIQWSLMALITGTTIGTGLALRQLSFLSDRIEIYLQWDSEGYGLPVNSYGTIILHCALLIVALFSSREVRQNPQFRTLIYLEILGIATFIAFSEYAIFAFRLSNLVLSLYPILILKIVETEWSPNINRRMKILHLIILILIGASLILRQGSFDIIDVIKI